MCGPSVGQGPDGTFHLVRTWTSSWRGELCFGYASTRDFIHWSEQKFISTMDFDTSTVKFGLLNCFMITRNTVLLLFGLQPFLLNLKKGRKRRKITTGCTTQQPKILKRLPKPSCFLIPVLV